MMAWTNAILQLQEVDIELQSNQQRLEEISLLLMDFTAVQDAQQLLVKSQNIAKQARINQETLEFELNKVQNKLRVDTERLYSGRITNARELQDLQAETESLKRHISTLEDKLLEAMLEREEADEDAAEAKQKFEQISEQFSSSQQNLTEEQSALTARNTEITVLIEDLHQQIPASILDTYEYLKPRTANIPVARLKGEICGICGIEVIKPMQQKARRDEEAYCGGCHRMLVVVD